MARNDLVLLTGGTGHIGFRILVLALQAGYRVRAAVRSSSKAETLHSNPLLKSLALPPSALQYVEIPDLTATGAYDEAVKDVTYVIHVASPIPSAHLSRSPSEAEEIFLKPAVQGTLGLLSAAKRSSSVRRVIITSSTTALVPGRQWGAQAPTPAGTVYSAESRVPLPAAPYPTLQAAYCASKVASFNAAEDWVKAEKPGFSVVHIHPSFVLGPDHLHLTGKDARSGTNMMCLGIAFGGKSEAPRVGAAVHLEDVARIHVDCLDEEKVKVEGTRSFVANISCKWQDVVDIVRNDFGEAVKQEVLSVDGEQPTMDMPIDSSETEAVFGFKFANFEAQVKSVLEHYIELQQKQ